MFGVCREDVKMQLDEIYKDKARGYQIRSRARWVEEGEQSSIIIVLPRLKLAMVLL